MKGNLLLLDDEAELSQSMKDLLEAEAQEIYIATTGEEAFKILETKKVDVIVSDVKMPGMDGLCFMKEAREKGFNQPVIFFTGYGTELLQKQVRELGAADLLKKPNFLMLELAIRKHMSGILKSTGLP